MEAVVLLNLCHHYSLAKSIELQRSEKSYLYTLFIPLFQYKVMWSVCFSWFKSEHLSTFGWSLMMGNPLKKRV